MKSTLNKHFLNKTIFYTSLQNRLKNIKTKNKQVVRPKTIHTPEDLDIKPRRLFLTGNETSVSQKIMLKEYQLKNNK